MSRTMARPRPLPGTFSSSRSPRSPTLMRSAGSIPSPSVTDAEFEMRAVAAPSDDRDGACAHLHALSMRFARHLLQILPCSAAERQIARTIDIDRKAACRMNAREHARQILEHRPHRRAVAEHVERAGRTRAGEVVIDLAAHGADLAKQRHRRAHRDVRPLRWRAR